MHQIHDRLAATRQPFVSELVELDFHDDGVVLLRMADRENKNQFSLPFIDAVQTAFAFIQSDPAAKVIVLTGHAQYFAAGGSKEGLMEIYRGNAVCTDGVLHSLPLECELPVIGAMQGHSIGSGWIMGMSCDLSILSEESVYQCPFMAYGFTPGAGATLIFPERFGPLLSKEILFQGKTYKGAELKKRGIAHPVLPRADVLPYALDMAARLARRDRAELVDFKRRHTGALRARLQETFEREIAMHEQTFVGNQEVVQRIEALFIEPGPQAPAGAGLARDVPQAGTPGVEVVQRRLAELLAHELATDAGQIGADAAFALLGLDSILGVTLVKKINLEFGTSLKAGVLYQYSTLADLARHVAALIGPLAEPAAAQAAPVSGGGCAAGDPLAETLRRLLADELSVPAERLDASRTFQALGLDSILGVQFIRHINAHFGLELKASILYACPGLAELAHHIAGMLGELGHASPAGTGAAPVAPSVATAAATVPRRERAGPRVAVIGIACQFPMAADREQFWNNIVEGRNCVSEVPESRWPLHGYFDPDPQAAGKSYSKWMGVLEGIAEFDPLFFNITPLEAEAMDPQQRLILQACWHSIEDAGYAPSTLSGSRCAVYIGCTPVADYAPGAGQDGLGAAVTASALAGRISYFLNLQGPCVALDTACSSSLVAIAQACDSIALGHADLALAGGCSVLLTPSMHIMTSKARMLSPAGRCAAFDRQADGFVPGEGVGVVLLKPLEAALAAGDQIYGTIEGWGVNHDGRTNGMTAPNPASQSCLQQEVYRRFGIDPAGIGLLEAHGTGTELGDPIEVDALIDSFSASTGRRGFCALGAVKSNIGHAMAASGVAGLIKALMAIGKQQLPPTIHYHTLNPHISLDGTPFFVNTETRPWPAPEGAPRMAAVNSFGLSGTNAHLVVAEHCAPVAIAAAEHGAQMIVLSAKTRSALIAAATRLADAIERDAALSRMLPSIAYTLQLGRDQMRHRLGLLASDGPAAVAMLRRFAAEPHPASGIHCGDAQSAQAAAGVPLCLDTPMTAAAQEEILARWCAGAMVDWGTGWRQSGPGVSRLRLPTYAFDRARFGIGGRALAADAGPAQAAPVAEWPDYMGYPEWRPLQPATGALGEVAHHVYLCEMDWADHGAVARALGARCASLAEGGDSLAQRFERHACTLFAALKEMDGGVAQLVQLVVPETADHGVLAGLLGLCNSAQLERPAIRTQLVLAGTQRDQAALVAGLAQLRAGQVAGLVRLAGSQALQCAWRDLARPAAPPPPAWRQDGVYLITGGMGGLGKLFAADIVRHARAATVCLVGRGTLDTLREGELAALQRHAGTARVVYRQVDVSDAGAVLALVARITAEFGTLSGVIHSAGVIRDNFMMKKSSAEFVEVLAPKVRGAINLDAATAALGLDFFVLFSAGAGVLGNVGQADYAAANAFMDRFAHHRHALAAQGLRRGRTLSINWPLWRNGGMRVDAVTERSLRENTGMLALSDQAGTNAFHLALASGLPQVLVMAGERERLVATLDGQSRPGHLPEAAPHALPSEALQPAILQGIKRVFGQVTGIAPGDLDAFAPLAEYGIDSIKVMSLNQLLAPGFGQLSKTVFFECVNLDEVATHLAERHRDSARAWVAASACATGPAIAAPVSAPTPTPAPPSSRASTDAVAIVGISGRFPGAHDLEAFWDNLVRGANAITEIPAERWPLDGFFDSDRKRAAGELKSYSKWGGFLDGFSEFDPLLFGISPKEAACMDPQERLFLQSCWHTLEDAAYTRQRLAQKHGGRVGVYAGITKTGFELYGPDLQDAGITSLIPRTSFASLANRVSYLFDFKGPSIPVDTMCSSSLVAIHLACEALRHGECELALAGGVNLYLHPSTYVVQCAQQMLSPDGQCRSFAADANGFVPGEGVGTVLLKLLQHAIADGDRIHAVIRATSVNHGGKTSGYTVPSPKAQAALVGSAITRAGLAPAEISYIEAHGTGTRLGDPIELNGLTRAFHELQPDLAARGQFCAIGSVKSNIGHLESAAGIAGLAKLVLQLRHRTLVPSINIEKLNPDIDFAGSPFRVQTEAGPWDTVRRCAGLSSFGAGGVNAHLILEEYVEAQEFAAGADAPPAPLLFALSARTEAQLRQRLRDLAAHLRQHDDAPGSLRAIAFTLQVGREEMEWRWGCVAAERSQLLAQLDAAADGPAAALSFVDDDRESIAAHMSDPEIAAGIPEWLASNALARILPLWLKGGRIDWAALYRPRPPRPVALPGYPFARELFWLPASVTGCAGRNTAPASPASPASPADESHQVHLAQPHWVATPLVRDIPSATGRRHILLAAGMDDAELAQVRTHLPQAHLVRLDGEVEPGLAETFGVAAVRLFEQLQALLADPAPAPVLLQLVIKHETTAQTHCLPALAAMLKTAHQEQPQIGYQVLQLSGDAITANLARIRDNLASSAREVRYRGAVRECRVVHLLGQPDVAQPEALPWKRDGVYLITGGAGGIGAAFAREIVRRCGHVTLVLAGRRAADGAVEEVLASLAGDGVTCEYVALDVGGAAAVHDCVHGILRRHGRLNGILHCAGTSSDSFLIKQSTSELRATLHSKVAGTVNLDQASWNIPLDLLVLFSSISGEVGNVGQADYATANAFMDEFAVYRAQLAAQGLRSGRTLALAWPLWRDGGMGVDHAVMARLQAFGLAVLDTGAALRAFYSALECEASRVIVASGRRESVQRLLAGAAPAAASTAAVPPPCASETLLPALEQALSVIFCECCGLDSARFDRRHPFSHYGIDSVMITQLTDRLERHMGPVSKTLFFQFQKIGALASHLLARHGDACAAWVGTTAPQPARPAAPDPGAAAPEAATAATAPMRIAVIGMTGRYPHAADLDAYWDVLASGRDCVEEVPAARWPAETGFYQPDPARAVAEGKSYSKWGGFLEDFDRFDPGFFNLSPWEAKNMDPQERLFIEACWNVLEDAGYTPQLLQRAHSGRVGVFAGITRTGYNLYSPAYWRKGLPAQFYTSFSSVANRVSYLLDLCGPSMPVDTMCSSSLVAVHLACQQLALGTCELTIAGGVNLYLHPSNYIGLSSLQMLAPDGRCRSFGEGGRGFVPGEGVGAVLLKPLAMAERDRDDILAVLVSSEVNHGGHTHGYSVPNPNAQAALVAQTLTRAGIDPASVSCIEAHGTGTELGDPIEIEGLTMAFEQAAHRPLAQAGQYCAIGSVKSNIGHLEAAAGIAGLTKLVLQLRHRYLVPTLHCDQPNPKIAFHATPFRLQREFAPWPTPADGGVRRGGVSSFGAAGVNAHVVVEEYVRDAIPARGGDLPGRQLILLSARSPEQLACRARRLLDWLARAAPAEADLERIAYTLQTGRVAMEVRLALWADSTDGLAQTLGAWLGGAAGEAVWESDLRAPGSASASQGDVPARQEHGDAERLLRAWLAGADVEWECCHPQPVTRLRLPHYVFAGERYWIDPQVAHDPAPVPAAPVLHPLLHQNVSNVAGLAFASALDASQFYLADHLVAGEALLPGVAHLEMACAAAAQAMPAQVAAGAVIEIRNMVWSRAVKGQRDSSLVLHLLPQAQDRARFEICAAGLREQCYSQGEIAVYPAVEPPLIDVARLRAAVAASSRCSGEVYACFAAAGIDYGPGMRAIRTLATGTDEHGRPQALAEIALPQHLIESFDRYLVHPSLMDAGFQATIGMLLAGAGTSGKGLALPFALDNLLVYGPTPRQAWAWCRSAAGSSDCGKVDIDIFDASGQVAIQVQGLSMRELAPPPGQRYLFAPAWTEALPPVQGRADAGDGTGVLCLAGSADELRMLQQAAGAGSVGLLPDPDADIAVLAGQLAPLRFEHVVWDAGRAEEGMDGEAMAARQRRGVILGFKLVKALLACGWEGRALALTVFTEQSQAVLPGQAVFAGQSSLHGFLGSIGNEYPQWRISLIDLECRDREPANAVAARRAGMAAAPEGGTGAGVLARRAGRWFRHELLVCEPQAAPSPQFAVGGVYVILGGAGGIGVEFSEYLITNYHARVYWIGRRPPDAAIAAEQERLGRLGPAPVYLAADARDRGQLVLARDSILARHPRVNGIVHSALVLKDAAVATMTQLDFEDCLAAKVDGASNLLEVFGSHVTDLALFFSSVQSFARAPGQCNYAAGCTFTDSFAAQLAGTLPFAVRVVNWGYWGHVGAVADAFHARRMQASGIASIGSAEAMEVVELAVASPLLQLGYVKTSRADALPLLAQARKLSLAAASTASRVREAQEPCDIAASF